MKFEQRPLYLAVDNDRTIGITVRTGGFSPYPEDAMNMAHYIDDRPSNVINNQQQLADAILFPREDWVFPVQTHGNRITEVTPSHRGINIDGMTEKLYGYDGLWTLDKNILLTMCYADCVPVYLYSSVDSYIALGHAGWRGTLGMVTGELINAYRSPEQLVCIIGPSICQACYEVNDDIKCQFDQLPFNVEPFFQRNDDGLYNVDLKALNREIALYHGVKSENIYISPICTAEHDDLFSYRREQGNTGRMLAFIGMRNNNDS